MQSTWISPKIKVCNYHLNHQEATRLVQQGKPWNHLLKTKYEKLKEMKD